MEQGDLSTHKVLSQILSPLVHLCWGMTSLEDWLCVHKQRRHCLDTVEAPLKHPTEVRLKHRSPPENVLY